MFHADNCYSCPTSQIDSQRLKTNTVSNTAFRGFGGPQGMLAIERVMDAIARQLGLDPLDVRKANLYRAGARRHALRPDGRGQRDAAGADRRARSARATIARAAPRSRAFNAASPILKRGIALTPVKFGISFTLIHLNQAGALVHVYTDGAMQLNHGGTEMGQGLFMKVAQVVAEEFGMPLDRVRITATTTAKVPNTSPTAASSGHRPERHGGADRRRATIKRAHGRVRRRAHGTSRRRRSCSATAACSAATQAMAFGELAEGLPARRVQLSAAGYYSTPKIHWDRAKATGRPFFYFAYGAACCEVEIDTLTGEMKVAARRHPARRRRAR